VIKDAATTCMKLDESQPMRYVCMMSCVAWKAVRTVIAVGAGAHQQSDISISATHIAITAAERATTTELDRQVSGASNLSHFICLLI